MTLIFGEHDDRTVEQLETCAADAAAAVLCADGHLGYSQPIGGVIAYSDKISPSGVGYDIGCGNKAVLTDLTLDDIEDDLPALADEIFSRISFGMGRNNDRPADHEVLDRIGLTDFEPQRAMLDLAASQLGTVGAGNHYVDVFTDELWRVWVGVHFGSRGFGHKTASGFLALAQGLEFGERASEGEMMSPPVLFDVDSELGQAYLEAMALAGEYAYAGRDVVVAEVVHGILGCGVREEVHNHHNYAWLEKHGGQELWVVRKGATPAFPGQRGFVGASMGGTSVILEGIDSERSREALYSTVHGAGRAMSRTKAAGKMRKRYACMDRDCDRVFEIDGISAHNGPPKRGVCPDHPEAAVKKRRVRVGGAIDFAEVQADLDARGIELRGGAADEAPAAYKSLPEVLRHHSGTIQVQHTLRPLIVCMAGSDTYDPFKD